MIARGFAPGCPSALERLIFDLVSRGVLSDVPGLHDWTPVAWFALPAVVVTLTAIALARAGLSGALLVTLALSTLLSWWLPFVLLPLFAFVTATRTSRRTWMAAVAISVAVVAGAWALSPACENLLPRQAGSVTSAVGSLAFTASAVGAAGVCLVAIRLVYGLRPLADGSLLAVALVSALIPVLTIGRDEPRVAAAGVTALWWLALSGGWLVVRWQRNWWSRAGVAALIALAVWTIGVRAAAITPAAAPPTAPTPTVFAALAHLQTPAALVSDGTATDVAVAVWRAARRPPIALEQIPLSDAAIATALGTDTVYAAAPIAERLFDRGFIPAPAAGDLEPIGVHRVLDREPCVTLSPSWQEITPLLDRGQLAGQFDGAVPSNSAIVYMALSAPGETGPANPWPREATGGLEVRTFDRLSPADRDQLAAIASREAFDPSTLPNVRHVMRLRLQRRVVARDALAINVGGIVAGAWARHSGEDDSAGTTSLCRRSAGYPVTGYPESPASTPLSLSSTRVVGRGWHLLEDVGGSRYRWTSAPEADLRFLVHEPGPLSLRLEAEPASSLRVSLNGTPARCEQGSPPCTWVLPLEALHHGLNVLTLHSTPTPAPPPDPRSLGLMVRNVVLVRP